MDVSTVTPDILTERLDAEFYRPSFLENHRLLAGLEKCSTLGEASTAIKLGYTGPIDDCYSTEGALFLTSKNIADGRVVVGPDTLRIRYDVHNGKLSSTIAKSGDLLFSRTGTVGKAAVLHDPKEQYNFAAHLFAVRVKETFDSSYLGAFFSSRFGALQSERMQRGTIIQGLSIYDMPGMIVPKHSGFVQKYIGTKLRQAEQLRCIASSRYAVNRIRFESQFVSKTIAMRCSRMDATLLADRLDHVHYRADLLDGYKLIKKAPHVVLGDKTHFEGLTDGDHGNPEYGNGPIYLRASEMDGFVIHDRRCTRLSDSYATRVPASCFGSLGDVVFSIVGTLGLVAAIIGGARIALSRGIAKVRPLQLPQHYVKAFMRSQVFGNELLRNSVGSVQRGVYLEALEPIPIPVLDDESIATIANTERAADSMLLLSESLVSASKQLIEELIERKINEDELDEAQKDLDRGSRSLDRAILSRLTEDGIDMADKPKLFADLDALYTAIDEAQQTQTSNGDAA